MKKSNIFAAIFAVALLSSCAVDTPKEVALTSKLDSVNYAFGVTNGAEIKQYYLANDSTGESLMTLLKGIAAGLKEYNPDQNPELLNLGKQIGTSLKQQKTAGLMGDSTLELNMDLINQGLVNGILGEETGMTTEEAQQYLQLTMDALQTQKAEKEFGSNKEAGAKFLAENATKENVKVTESGLQYEVLKAGRGAKPAASDRVKVHYHGTLIDGTVFDSSVDRGEPATFGVTQVIPGWVEALQLMTVGSKWKLYIPYDLAYGERKAGSIPPYSALIFEVELLSIEK